MSKIKSLKKMLDSKQGLNLFQVLYGQSKKEIRMLQRSRYTLLLDRFEIIFQTTNNPIVLSSPGRAELGGNHTDHENGHVLAAAINLDTLGVIARNHTGTIRIFSEGFPPVNIGIEKNWGREKDPTALLVQGVCQYFMDQGYGVGGFNALLVSAIPFGSGLSSSASFEILIAQALNLLFNQGKLEQLSLALAGQYSEIEFYGKPCGLMDQLACALGGVQAINFKNPMKPITRSIHGDLNKTGYALVITNTGGSHVGLTGDYKAIIAENRAVAQHFGVSYLGDVKQSNFERELPILRLALGDRAILRAHHFFKENIRVQEQVRALENGDFDRYLFLVNESGLSSWKYLQNYFSCNLPDAQGIPLGMMLSEKILAGRGAYRVHGGGFAGSIQAYVPNDAVESYRTEMERVFGPDSCIVLKIRTKGVVGLSGDGEIEPGQV